MWVLGSNIAIGHMVSVVFSMWVVGPKIAIGLYLLDTWSVLCVPYVGAGI